MMPRKMTFWKTITLICATFVFVEAKWHQHYKRETKQNLCDPANKNTNKIQCYCRSKDSHDPEMITTADCYPTVDDITPDDAVWNEFIQIKHVNKLTMSNNRLVTLKYIPKMALKHTTALKILDVKYSNISTIDSFAFANLTLLEELTLRGNQIKILKVHGFAHHRDLKTISLDTNNIVEINRDVFIDLPNLEKLFMTNNRITTIHDRAFVHLNHLKELEMDRNNLFSLNSETFSGLKSLEKLELSGNSLEVIGDNTFLPLTNLRVLNLDGNKIQMLDEKAFHGLSKLQSLSLAHNAISAIENVKIFKGLVSLASLSLRANKLRELKPGVMAPILENFYRNVSTLDVEDNYFPCDCRLDWFTTLMNKTQSSNLKQTMENFKCYPDAAVQKKWVEDAEKNAPIEDEQQNQGGEGDYYDETELNGKLFYLDVRYLLECGNDNVGTTSKATVKETPLTDTTKATSPVNNKPTTSKSVEINKSGQSSNSKTEALGANDLLEKPKYTTSRLATVSAKPIDNKGYEDRDMASDEAKPDNIKAHRSVQDEVKHDNINNANRNIHCKTLITIILCFRLFQ